MKFENAFDVQAPAEDVWEALMDVERVAPCMPGAEVLERVSDDDYKVGIKVKLGPISMLYRGQIEIVERDDAARRATMRAKAKEARGQGTADASVQMAVTEAGGMTHAEMTTDVALSGKAAAMGQGVIGEVAQRMVEQFAANLATMLEPAEAAAPSNGGAPCSQMRYPSASSRPACSARVSRIGGSARSPRCSPRCSSSGSSSGRDADLGVVALGHIAGIPLEETLLFLVPVGAAGIGAVRSTARGKLGSFLKNNRRRAPERTRNAEPRRRRVVGARRSR
jgi:carbon monoxide dehydrogenase subunit G